MNYPHEQQVGHEHERRDVLSEEYQALFSEFYDWLLKSGVEPTDFTDDMPDGGEPAKRYQVSVPAEQAQQVFRVPKEISEAQPHDFAVTLVTAHRFDNEESPHVLLDANYKYGEDKTASYFVSGEVVGETPSWSGDYFQEDDLDTFVEDVHREMDRGDYDTLRTILGYAMHAPHQA